MDPSQDLQDSLDAMPDSPPGAMTHCPPKHKGKGSCKAQEPLLRFGHVQ
jgi:hypothetical protein